MKSDLKHSVVHEMSVGKRTHGTPLSNCGAPGQADAETAGVFVSRLAVNVNSEVAAKSPVPNYH